MRWYRDPSLRVTAGGGVLAALAIGGAVLLGASAPTGTPPPPMPSPPPAELACPDADGNTGELRTCLAGSIVFIETPIALGTGVLLDTGEIITNAHVVDPFAHVDVTFVGGHREEGVEVVGIVAADDIALLGPIEGTEGGVHLGALPDYREVAETDVFLVGFPGGYESDHPEVAITKGVLSRLRRSERFDQVLLQSDAVIAGGQSGGALVDGSGRLLGISGYNFESFSFALLSDDVIEAIDRIHAGEGTSRVLVPDDVDDWRETIELEFPASEATRQLIVPASDDDRTVALTIDSGEYTVDIYTMSGLAIGYHHESYDTDDESDDESDDDSDDDSDPLFGDDTDEWYTEHGRFLFGDTLAVDEDGAISFEVPASEIVLIDIARELRGRIDVTVDVPYVEVAGYVDGEAIEIGDTVRGTIDSVNGMVAHEIELDEGDEITVKGSGAPLVPAISLLTPREHPLDTSGYYGGFGGWGLSSPLGFLTDEVTASYTVNRSGTFTVLVSSVIPSAYELSVDRIVD